MTAKQIENTVEQALDNLEQQWVNKQISRAKYVYLHKRLSDSSDQGYKKAK